jgi:tetratricopeptide (TPR) repeat protein
VPEGVGHVLAKPTGDRADQVRKRDEDDHDQDDPQPDGLPRVECVADDARSYQFDVVSGRPWTASTPQLMSLSNLAGHADRGERPRATAVREAAAPEKRGAVCPVIPGHHRGRALWADIRGLAGRHGGESIRHNSEQHPASRTLCRGRRTDGVDPVPQKHQDRPRCPDVGQQDLLRSFRRRPWRSVLDPYVRPPDDDDRASRDRDLPRLHVVWEPRQFEPRGRGFTANDCRHGRPGGGLSAEGWTVREQAEKEYREGLVAYLTGNLSASTTAMEVAVAAEPKAMSAHIVAALSLERDEDTGRAIRHLETAISSDEPFPDKLMQKFLPAGATTLSMGVKITDFMSARVPFDLTGAALVLAEGYQQTGRLEEAIGLVQQLHDADPTNEAIGLSLADLLFDDHDFEGVVEITANAQNNDDLGVALIYMRAAALTGLGHSTASLDAFKEALAKTANRDADLLATVRYDRAMAFEHAGQKAKARADYERLYAASPGYRDVRERLAAL